MSTIYCLLLCAMFSGRAMAMPNYEAALERDDTVWLGMEGAKAVPVEKQAFPVYIMAPSFPLDSAMSAGDEDYQRQVRPVTWWSPVASPMGLPPRDAVQNGGPHSTTEESVKQDVSRNIEAFLFHDDSEEVFLLLVVPSGGRHE